MKSLRDKDDGREYQIMGATPALQKEPYTTFIGLVPQCSCPDHLRNGNGGPCKHIVWIYLYIFKLDRDDKLLQQTSLTVGELTRLLAIDKIDEEYKFRGRKPASRYEICKRLLKDDQRNVSYDHKWSLVRKEKKRGKNPTCTSCKREMEEGKMCLQAKGLYVPFEQEFVQEKNFYFCSQRSCISSFPFYTNLVSPASVALVNKVTDMERKSLEEEGIIALLNTENP